MKTSILVLAALVVVAFSSIAFAAYGSITNATVTADNATAGFNGTYYIQFNTSATYGGGYNLTNFSVTFPPGTILTSATPYILSSGGSGSLGGLISLSLNDSVGSPNNTNVSMSVSSNVLTVTFQNVTNGSYVNFDDINISFYLRGVNITAYTNQTSSGGTLVPVYIIAHNTTQTGGWGSSTTGTPGSGINASRFTMLPGRGHNVTAYAGNAQTITADNKTGDVATYTNITVLVQDDFGNFITSANVSFTYMNESTMTTPSGGVLLYGVRANASNSSWSTNDTGHASFGIKIGNSTQNGSNTYQWNVSVTNWTMSDAASSTYGLKVNATASANIINYYIVTPASTSVATDTAFTVVVHSYDMFSNINGTSGWNGTLNLSSSETTGLTYSTDGTSYSAWGSAGTNRDLSSGNVTSYFKQSINADLTFNFTDSAGVTATGISSQVQVRSGGVSGGGGSTGGSSTATPTPTPSATVSATPTPTPAPSPIVSEKNLGAGTMVSGSFGEDSTTFSLTYAAGSSGFYGDLTWTLPFDYADYQAGLITITPAPANVEAGSVKAMWNNVDLPANGKFTPTVTVDKKLDSSVMDQFAVPTLAAKARPATVATPIPTSSVAPQPVKKPGAGGDNSLLIGIVVLILLAAGAYYFFLKPKKRGM